MTTENTDLHWETIASLRLRLKPHVSIHRHQYRDRDWTVLYDGLTPASYRFDSDSAALIRALDGRSTLAEVVAALEHQEAPYPLSTEETVALVAQLHAANLLQGDVTVGASEVEAHRRREGRNHWLRRLATPTAIRIPLVDPDRLLQQHVHRFRLLFQPAVAILWGVMMLVGLVLVMNHWGGLVTHAVTRGMDPLSLFLLLLVFPPIKFLHESAHALATRFWGGEVREAGIMLLVFMPVPYVDASASVVFDSKWRRIAVSAAGLMTETMLAALALIVWINVQPGLVRDAAFAVILIGGVATVLFNGNPLLRFDAYYILADLLEIPNLGSRANRYIGFLCKRHLLGLEDERAPILARGERGWLLGYGVASFCYRIYISLVIALFVAGRFFVVGTILAIWVVISQLLLPLLKLLRYLLLDESLGQSRGRSMGLLGGGLLAGLLLMGLLPFPAWTIAEGVISMPEQAQVRAGTDGFVERVLVADGDGVTTQTPLFQARNRELPVKLAVAKARLQELKAEKTSRMLSDRSLSGIIEEQITATLAEIEQLQREQALLDMRSPRAGRFRAAHAADIEGRFLREGDLLGYIATDADFHIRVVVPQGAIELVRESTRNVEVRLAGRPGRVMDAAVLQEVPAVGRELPSPALGTAGGGRIAVDGRDTSGITALENIYFIDISLPYVEGEHFVGAKAHVRFDHRPEPLLRQWWRSLRQLFLARLET